MWFWRLTQEWWNWVCFGGFFLPSIGPKSGPLLWGNLIHRHGKMKTSPPDFYFWWQGGRDQRLIDAGSVAQCAWWKEMDCCPLMVSELPVVCSRIDGVVTVVKAEQPGPASCRHLNRGESSLVSIVFVVQLKSVIWTILVWFGWGFIEKAFWEPIDKQFIEQSRFLKKNTQRAHWTNC